MNISMSAPCLLCYKKVGIMFARRHELVTVLLLVSCVVVVFIMLEVTS